jgi:hypothetical protein
VLRAWCPFLINRGPVSQLGTTPTRRILAMPSALGNQVNLVN